MLDDVGMGHFLQGHSYQFTAWENDKYDDMVFESWGAGFLKISRYCVCVYWETL